MKHQGVLAIVVAATAMVFVVPVAAGVRTIEVPAQPVSPHLDTEVSTNVVVQTGRTDVLDVRLRLQIAGTPTNDLEVAFGRDANANGVLDPQEVETVYGWRGGRYFVENVRAWERIEAQPAAGAQWGVLDVHVENGPDFAPRRLTAVCGGVSAFDALASSPPSWLFRREWDVMRVVRRGAGTPAEWVRCEVGHGFLYIHLR